MNKSTKNHSINLAINLEIHQLKNHTLDQILDWFDQFQSSEESIQHAINKSINNQ